MLNKNKKSKQLVWVLITSMLVTYIKNKILKYVLCIYCLIFFWKNSIKTKSLIDNNYKINAIILAYTLKLDF